LEEKGNLNLYLFTSNDGINLVDRDGRIVWWGAAILGGGAIGGGIKLISNLVQGKPPFEGVPQAALTGAIGGLTATGVGSPIGAGTSLARIAAASFTGGVVASGVAMAIDDKQRTLEQGAQELLLSGGISALTAGVFKGAVFRTEVKISVSATGGAPNWWTSARTQIKLIGCKPISAQADRIRMQYEAHARRVTQEMNDTYRRLITLFNFSEGVTPGIVDETRSFIFEDAHPYED